MYGKLPSFVLGFHGCDKSVADGVLNRGESLRSSDNSYDWLGPGVYFWEQNPGRALSWAAKLAARPIKGGPRVFKPAVIGAVIDLGLCLNLLDEVCLRIIRNGYDNLIELSARAERPLPRNRTPGGSRDPLLRDLDCAVVKTVHQLRRDEGQPPFDSVRSAFIEGEPLYPTAGFHARNHIQICVCNPGCIKGYFRPLGMYS